LSLITILYFAVRYYSLINLMAIVGISASTNLGVPACQRYFLWSLPAGPPLLIGVLNGILLLRVFALYDRSKRVLVILLILSVGTVASALYATIRLARGLASSVVPMPVPWRGCASKLPGLGFVLTAYVPNYALSLIFLAMTLCKLLKNHKHIYGKLTLKNMRAPGNRDISPLLLAFVRDGNIFFVLASIATFLELLPIFVVRGQAASGFLPWILAIYSYSGAHLILNLRAAGMMGSTPTYQTWDETLSVQHRPSQSRGTFT